MTFMEQDLPRTKLQKRKKENLKGKMIAIVALTLVTTSAITYGFFYPNKRQTGQNDLVSECFNIEFTNESASIALTNAYPVSDEEGKKFTPYSFTITNTCNLVASYHVVIDTKIGSFDPSHIKVSVNDSNPKTLTFMPNESYPAGEGYSASGQIYSGTLKKDESKNFDIKLWMSASTTYEQVAGKTWEGRVRVVSSVSEVDQYLNQGTSPSDITLAKLGVTANAGTPDFTQIAATDEGIYGMEDDYGMSYYYRGAVTNNYVKFGKWSADTSDTVYGTDSNGWVKEFATLDACNADSSYKNNCTLISRAGKDMYWRIVSVNEDGTLRVIYDGVEPHSNTDTSTDRIIGISPWNEYLYYNDAKYVGYMFGGANGEMSTSKEQAQTNETASTMKTYLENWYKKQIVDQSYDGYVSNNIFCNDRSTVSTPSSAGIAMGMTDTGLGYGTNDTLFGYWNRFDVNTETNTVTSINVNLKCPNKNDAFTSIETTKGNGKMTYPVGFITADEFSIAGSVPFTKNPSYYLNKANMANWTFSPSVFLTGYAFVSLMNGGNLGHGNVDNYTVVVASVINLSTEFVQNMTGDGTASNPFRLPD